MGHGLQVRVQDAPLCVDCFAVSVLGGRGVEALGEEVLSFGGEVMLVFKDYYLVVVEGGMDC